MVIGLMTLLLLASCSISKKATSNYPKINDEKPVAILVMPPINKTNHVEADEMIYSSLMTPFANKGYYVFPPMLSLDFLRHESAPDAEPFLNAPVKIFGDIMGADAVLFTVIKQWDKDALNGDISINIRYLLRSAKSNETLFDYSEIGKVDTKVMNSNDGVFSFVAIIANAISTALTDKIGAARNANLKMIQQVPGGKYYSK